MLVVMDVYRNCTQVHGSDRNGNEVRCRNDRSVAARSGRRSGWSKSGGRGGSRPPKVRRETPRRELQIS